jgi:hypothetical protein
VKQLETKAKRRVPEMAWRGRNASLAGPASWDIRRLKRVVVTVLLVLTLSAAYCSNLRLVAAGDSFPTALTAFSLAVDHSLTLDRIAPWVRTNIQFSRGLIVPAAGHYRSVYPIGQAILAAPLIAPAATVLGVGEWEAPRQVYFARLAEKIVAALITSLTVAVVFWTLRLIVTGNWPWGLAFIFAFGTSCWPITSQAFWQQTGGQFCGAVPFYLLALWLRRTECLALPFIAGICCAMSVWVRPTNLLFAVAFAAPLLLFHRAYKATAAFAFFPTLAVVALGIYNAQLFGSILGGYRRTFESLNDSPVIAFATILTSPGRGIFFFSPVLLFALVGILRKRTWLAPQRPFALACLLVVLLQLLVVASWPQWWGGASWGSRLLTETGPPLIFLIALGVPAIANRPVVKTFFWASAAISICIQAIGAYCYPNGGWDELTWPIHTARFWDLRDNPIYRNARFGIDSAPYRASDRLRQRDTWTLASVWRQTPPEDIVALRWWALPHSQDAPMADPAILLKLKRRSVSSCFLDVARLKTTYQEERIPLSLEVVGWAFDAGSGTVPKDVFAEISRHGRAPVVAPANRWARPDVAQAFHNGLLSSSGISADILLDQPASSITTSRSCRLHLVRSQSVSLCTHASAFRVSVIES